MSVYVICVCGERVTLSEDTAEQPSACPRCGAAIPATGRRLVSGSAGKDPSHGEAVANAPTASSLPSADLQSRLSDDMLEQTVRPSIDAEGTTVRLGTTPAAGAAGPAAEGLLPPKEMRNWQELALLPLPENPSGVIGEGGQAIIYSYVQKDLGREVAVKALRPEKRSFRAAESLVREACATARLEHPHIIPVHYLHVPEHASDAPYWVMKRVYGHPLSEHVPGGSDPWPLQRLLDTYRKVLDAIKFAHSRGIVHRDLKPENILVGAFGEVQVTDWGLAVAMTEDAARAAHPQPESSGPASTPLPEDELTHLATDVARLNEEVRAGKVGPLPKTTAGGRAGTPAYMAPEQLRATAESITERTDIFLLGGLLYAILTGVPPHNLRGVPGVHERSAAIQSCSTIARPPERRTQRDMPAIPDGLSAPAMEGLSDIAMKALSPDPAQRHASVQELADALGQWEARAASYELGSQAEDRLRKVAGGKKGRSRALAEVIALANAALERLPANERARQVRDRAAHELAVVEGRARHRFWIAAAAIFLVFVAVAVGYERTWKERVRAEQMARQEAEQRSRAEGERRKAEAAGLVARQERDRALQQSYFAGVGLADRRIAEGDLVAARELLLKCPPSLRHWEWRRLMSLCRCDARTFIGHTSPVTGLALSQDGRRLLSVAQTGEACVWDTESGFVVARLANMAAPMAYDAAGDRFACSGAEGAITILDADEGEPVFFLRHPAVCALAFSATGRKILTVGGDLSVRVWDGANGMLLADNDLGDGLVRAAAISPDLQQVVAVVEGRPLAETNGPKTAAGCSRVAEVYSIAGDPPVLKLNHPCPIFAVAWSPDGTRIATGSGDATVRIWDAHDGRELLTLSGHGNRLRHVAFSRDSRRLLSISYDGSLRVWDATSGAASIAVRQGKGRIPQAYFDSAGERIVAGQEDGTIELWPLASDKGVRQIRGGYTTYRNLPAVDLDDGRRIVFEGADGSVRVDPSAPEGLSPDGRRRATWGTEADERGGSHVIRLLDSATGAEIVAFRERAVAFAGFSPDSRLFFLGGARGCRIYNAEDGREIKVLTGLDGGIMSVQFDTIHKRMLTCHGTGALVLWNMSDWQILKRFGTQGGQRDRHFARLSSDGARLAACDVAVVRLWDVETGQETLTIREPTGMSGAIAFSQDGTEIIVAGMDGVIRIWSAPPPSASDSGNAR
jgi:WD40 repeat protein/serine/threonine protein kinase